MIVCVKVVAAKVAVTSHVGDFSARWVGDPRPKSGDCIDVEVSLGHHSLTWGADICAAPVGAERGLIERDGTYIMTGLAKGADEGGGLFVLVAPDCLVLLTVGGACPRDLDETLVVARSDICELYPTNL